MANGLNAILGFENSRYVKRGFSSIYDCCRYVGVLSILVTVGIIVVLSVYS
jgi:hypothetical protein